MVRRLRLVLFILIPMAAACGGELPEPIGLTAQAQLVDNQLPDISPAIPVPSGYGTYCSITTGTGGWWLGVEGQGGDPCGHLQKNNGASGTIQRAGLWSLNHTNNAILSCSGVLLLYEGQGSTPMDSLYATATAKGYKNCVFTVAPKALPIFTTPIRATSYNYGYSVPNFDRGGSLWDPRMFGQDWGDSFQKQYCSSFGGIPGQASNQACNSNADCTSWFATSCQHEVPWDQKHCVTPRCSGVAFDRSGTERAYSSTCTTFGCNFEPAGPNAFEGAYDWGQPDGTPLLAMADGVVAFSGCRDYQNKGPYPATVAAEKAANCQEELFVEHQVGVGRYAEHFIAAYHHMDWAYPMAATGTIVHRGDVIGYIGTSGNSGGDHLDLSVSRTTNLSAGRSYQFVAEPTYYSACKTAADCNTSGATTYSCKPPAANPSLNCASSFYGCNCVSSYGANGNPGVIDPYGWGAPSGFDPQSWMFLGQSDGTLPAGVTSDGALSINLMDASAWPVPYYHYPLPPSVGPTVQ